MNISVILITILIIMTIVLLFIMATCIMTNMYKKSVGYDIRKEFKLRNNMWAINHGRKICAKINIIEETSDNDYDLSMCVSELPLLKKYYYMALIVIKNNNQNRIIKKEKYKRIKRASL